MQKIFRTPGLDMFMLAEGQADNTIQMFRMGTFFHPVYGKFEISKEFLLGLKKNFDEKVRGIDISIDYSHENEKEAAGWIKSLDVTDKGEMYAEVEWTPKGKERVSNKEYRYISPEFTFDYKDNETLKSFGPLLLGAGLTNRPVIKKMEALALQEYKEPEIKNKEVKKMDLKAMEPEALKAMPQEQLVALVQELMGKMKEMESGMEMANKKLAETEEEKKLAEKKSAFVKLLTEGKACAAQEESFIAGDMAKFAELAQPVKLSEKGNASEPETKPTGTVVDQIMALAEKKVKDKSAKDLSEAVKLVLSENTELNQKYLEGGI